MITILGATGFVGTALKNRLQKQGTNVCGLSRPIFDLGKKETYPSIPKQTRVLVHSAGPAGSEHSEDRYWNECVKATYDLVEFINSKRKNIELIIYVSSGAVYSPSETALTEESELKPGNLYAMTRLLSENIISKKANCRATILRLFFPYGPGQKSPRLIPELTRKITAGETIKLNNENGLPVLNPIFIEDLAAIINDIINSETNRIINIGGSEQLSIREIAEKIGRELHVQPKFEVENGESKNFYCDCAYPCNTMMSTGLAKFLKQDKSNV
ncbi:NAD-dependent epimerase/dehydratase family protein [Maridesulfovibrio hydrothermalis]|uniref:NAD-dependent epimerase/dehydratase domain-containing protein n=1 Tax=Maridesulfovibrio hydrothermalis AM13 = DSM 14728 TaxID=1121451 RepID=L0R8X4_9BACT|nr:NAD(P)-dependent oxidoreductase [Maridesulfovibrio hydrothermalis]CCO23213.1 conserved protein of unknown function [Maridesulfovibrio hydrothermalis AM13 = DSM 14728]